MSWGNGEKLKFNSKFNSPNTYVPIQLYREDMLYMSPSSFLTKVNKARLVLTRSQHLYQHTCIPRKAFYSKGG